MNPAADCPRAQPQNLEAEQAVLGAILLENAALVKVARMLTEEHFYRSAHRKIYRAMLDLSECGEVIDQITLTEHLKSRGELDSVGGAAYLAELISVTPSPSNIISHSELLCREAVRRQLICGADELVSRAYRGADVRELAERAERLRTMTTAARTGSDPALRLTPLGALLSEPDETVSYIVDARLPVGGLSLLVAKPKAGKSTMLRALALRVSRGEPFLGFSTSPGPVLYLALEEKRSEVRRHFERMGARPDDPVYVYIAPSPEKGLPLLRWAAEQYRPVLILVDPLFKLVRVADGNDYAQMTAALEPLLTLARETDAHVIAAHHLGKAERQGGDSILGSTAIFAAVDTVLLLKRAEKYRTLSSIQRYGVDLEEITLTLHPETYMVEAGPPRQEMDMEGSMEAILAFLAAQSKVVEERAVHENVEGRKAIKMLALRRLVEVGKVLRSGHGKRGSPYLYSISGILVPSDCEKPENQKPEIATRGGNLKANAGSHDFEGRGVIGEEREPECEQPAGEDSSWLNL